MSSFCHIGFGCQKPERLLFYPMPQVSFFRKEKCMIEKFKVIDNYLMVKMPEEIDHHQSLYISENVDKYILGEQVNNVVFDFEGTKFMDSSGIGIILGRYKKIACFGGKVFAINAASRIRHLLMISGLHKIMEIMD